MSQAQQCLLSSSSLTYFHHVPLTVGGYPLGYEERSEDVGLIGRAIIFQDFQLFM